MELKAGLVGCGAMSRAWLQAAAKIPDLRVVALADLDTARARSRAAEFSLNDAVIASDVNGLIAASHPDLLFDVVVPSARHDVVSAGLASGLPCPQRKADGRDARGRARSRRAGEGRRAHPRRCAESALSCWSAPDRPGVALRRDRRDHQRSRRLLPRAALRRLSRGDGPRSAARHGDPRLRRACAA